MSTEQPNTPAEGAPAKPAAATPEAAKKKSKLKRLLKVCFVLFVLLVVTLVVAPTVLSATVLTGLVQGQLRKQVGPNASVDKVAFHWTSGLVLEKLAIPSGDDAKQKDRKAVELAGVTAKLSVPDLAKAAATGGEGKIDVTVDRMSVYLELHPGGKTNIPLPEAPAATPAPVAASQPAPASGGGGDLPLSALTTLDVKGIDLEVADMTSSTGAVQRILLKNLRMGVVASVARDKTAKVDVTKDEKGGELPTLAFDTCTITLEQPGKPDKLILGVEKPSVVSKVTYAGKAPASAANAPIPALAAAHQVEGKPTIGVDRLQGDGFDMRRVGVNCELLTDKGKKLLRLVIDGALQGKKEGKVLVKLEIDLGGKPRLPISMDVKLSDCDMSGAFADALPKLLPVLAGTKNEKGDSKLPTMNLATKADVAPTFLADGKLDKDPTIKSLASAGELNLGPGSFEGSTILNGFLEGFEQLKMKDVLLEAMGDRGLSFDGVQEIYEIKDGNVSIPKLELARAGFGLNLKGNCTFEGGYKMGVGFADVMYERCKPDVAKLLKSVDRAGGITVEGTLGGAYKVTTPPADVLMKALIDGGAVDLFRSKAPGAAKQLDGFLGKTGTSVEKVLEDPKTAAKDAAAKTATDQSTKAIDKNKDKIDKLTGGNADKAKDAIGGLFGGGDKKPEEKKPDEPKPDAKPEEKKPEEKPLLPGGFKNPFGK